ncbi:MAG: tetratricopeptide repeat protein [Candidatus Promineifilaceae bacterium]|nr:tetratricopeptide repeat protein [Candidatus Promineifilaceae bacterium]
MKREKLSIIIIGVILLAGLVVATVTLTAGQEADANAVEAANQLYVAGHYAEAAQIYEEQIALGAQDSALYYNLGNAYFQQGDLGRAVLNLERAAQLNPRDTDIQANLELVRGQTTELFAAEETAPGPVSLLADATSWMTQNEAAVLVLGLWFLFIFLLVVRRAAESERARRSLQTAAAIVLVLLLISGISLASRSFVAQSRPAGVVVSPSVAVSSGPGAEFVTGFTVGAGTAVQVAEQQGEWLRLAAPDGAEASWVPLDAVELT